MYLKENSSKSLTLLPYIKKAEIQLRHLKEMCLKAVHSYHIYIYSSLLNIFAEQMKKKIFKIDVKFA